jgi:hypothetical protein
MSQATAPAQPAPVYDTVWVSVADTWRPGVILAASPAAATVRYRPGAGAGTAVDTVPLARLAARHDVDQLDGGQLGRRHA